MKKLIFSLVLLIMMFQVYSQTVYQHVSNVAIYEFIDELANQKIIDLNSAIKPYSRMFIATKLKEAKEKEAMLNNRQKKELDFYLKDYNKELMPDKKFKKRIDLFYYKDSLFTLSVNPILGINYLVNDSGTFYHRWSGGEVFSYIGKNWGIYTSLRDNHETEPFSLPSYLTQNTGIGAKESANGGIDYSEMRGGLTYSNSWVTVALVKDHFVWGNNYNGANIFSGKTPSIATIKLNIHPVWWFDFNYVHGWLASKVMDTLRSYNFAYGTRLIYYPKHLSANMLTITPFKKLNISLGNSIVYSEINNIGYAIPFFFYKSLDHSTVTQNSGGGNSQMFLDISSRQIKYLHLYTTLFLDELSIERMWNDTSHSNFYSFKGGLAVSNLIPNLTVIGEYTRTNPMVYKHFVPTTTFESGLYNMGHYLRDNSQEVFVALRFKPLSKLHFEISYTKAEHGTDYIYTGIGNNGLGLPYLDTVRWSNESYIGKVSYELINDGFLFFEYMQSNTRGNVEAFTPAFLRGRMKTFSFGINYGF
jgi:hypothetical protein